MWEWLEALSKPLIFVFDPHKRIYWFYLLSSLLLAIIISGRAIFKIKPWLNASSAFDLIWLFINQGLSKLILVPLFAMQISLLLMINNGLQTLFGRGEFFIIDDSWLSIILAFSLFICNDFGKFLVHRAMHRTPWLWRFHALHHSATSMTPLTLYRIHPVELAINALRNLLINVLISSLFVYLFKNNLSVFDLLGVNIFVFIFNIAGSNLRHSHIWLGFGRWEQVFISPAQHQIHHSAEHKHFNKNFGSALAIWDSYFKTLLLSQHQQVEHFGLDKSNKNRQRFRLQWLGIDD
ncbi:sterol desaturase family protein [Psychromonas antarctica]|uniref:sterol desaturase family protein n=1 Tax=Psychromonas antarctica TaxID=67573 RepID=UPI001EE98B98|nr:sterol desaturase family protein [Psychromonas antarctica]MCG6201884.1 sterol desaturase family protein [Psychromonas antarctica]